MPARPPREPKHLRRSPRPLRRTATRARRTGWSTSAAPTSSSPAAEPARRRSSTCTAWGGSAASAGTIPALLGDDQRVCAYDRVNSTGLSDQVDGPLTGKDQVADLHGLLAAADEPGPYVLLGGSHGGLIADMYAATYPQDVVGIVLLDSPLPDTLKYENRVIPKADRPELGTWEDSPEKDDDLTTFRQAQALQGNEPRIPLTYLATKVLELPPSLPRAAITAPTAGCNATSWTGSRRDASFSSTARTTWSRRSPSASRARSGASWPRSSASRRGRRDRRGCLRSAMWTRTLLLAGDASGFDTRVTSPC